MTNEEKISPVMGKTVTVEVVERDTSGNFLSKRNEDITIKELTISQHGKATSVVDDNIEFIVLCTGKPKEWVESLTYDSLDLLDQTCEEVNSGFFRFLIRRQKRWALRLKGFDSSELEKMSLIGQRQLQKG